MKYGLVIFVDDCNTVEPFHIVEKTFSTLEEAEYYYNQYEGKEFFDREILYNDMVEIKYVVLINLIDNGDIVGLVKGKYNPLDLEHFYPQFWKIFNFIKTQSR